MKIKIKNFLFILLSILFIGILHICASAQETGVSETIRYIELEINENGIVDVTQNMEVHAREAVYGADTIIPKAENIEIYDSGLDSRLEYGSVIIGDDEMINFYFHEALNAGEKRNITIKYETEFFTNKQGETWELSFLLNVSNNSMVKIIFPDNVIISFTSSEIVPWAYVENSRQVLELKSVGDEIDFLCEYRFMEVQKPDETGLIQTKNETQEAAIEERGLPEMLIVVVILILILICFAALYYLKFKKSGVDEKKQNRVNPSIIELLDENERAVVELLQSMDDKITQAYIRKSTKIPGSTLSDVMLRLERRNIIERREEGKTKWVRLKEWVFQ